MGREYIPSLEERKEIDPRFNWYKSDFGDEIWLDPTLAHNLLCLRSDAKRSNGDMVLVIVGEEGCQPAGSKVLLSNGKWKNIEEVKLNDELFSPQEDGSTTVEKTEKLITYNSPCNYEIVDSDSNEVLYTCSRDHLVYLLSPFEYHIKAKPAHEWYYNQSVNGIVYKQPIQTCSINKARNVVLRVAPGSQVYGFSMSGTSKLYITDNGCVTHNSGKSQLGRQIGRFLDPTFDERRIEFSPEEAKEAHFKGLPSLSSSEFVPQLYREGKYEGKPWQVIELDESAKLDRKKTMSAGSVEFMGFISQSRQLHKIFIMILPNVHMLDGYIAEHRTLAVIKTEKNKRTNARYYTWYTRKHIKQMFTSDMHKRKLYPARGAFSGTFTNLQPFDITNYERKKAAALQAYKRKEEQTDLGDQIEGANREDIIRTIEEAAILACLKDPKIDQPSVYKALHIARDRWTYLKKAVRKKYGLAKVKMVGPLKGFRQRQEFISETAEGLSNGDGDDTWDQEPDNYTDTEDES